MLDNLVLGDEGLSLSINGVATRFDYFWLRDNARDPVSFDSRSHQRELFTAALDPHIKPTAGQLNGNASALLLDWPDLDMAAEYDATFLADFAGPTDHMRLPAPRPWDRDNLDADAVRLPFASLQAIECRPVDGKAAGSRVCCCYGTRAIWMRQHI